MCTESGMLGELRVAPGLLIAMPQLRDPNFDRSVVLMIEHRTEGSFGLVINRPTRTPIGHLLKSIDIDWQGTQVEVAWSGGPVQPETGWILHEKADGLDALGTREILPNLFITSAPDALRELADVGTGNPALLSPSSPARGGTDKNWNLRINTEVEPDL